MLALGTLTEGRGGEGCLVGCAVRNLDEKQKQGKTRLSRAASIHLRAWAESGRARNLHFFPRFSCHLVNLDPDLELSMGGSLGLMVLIRKKQHQGTGFRYPCPGRWNIITSVIT